MIAKTRLIFLTMVVASLTFGIAALTTSTLMTQPASAQSGGTPSYTPPPGGSAGSASPGNSTSGNATK
ncbi:MAG TPA: hypothetical protein VH500_07110 [Nitrososphaeraceae archaeon]|jgi:hypothetical protein